MRRLRASCVLPIVFSLGAGCVSGHERSSRRAFEALGPAPLAPSALPVAEPETPEIADLSGLLVEAALHSPVLRAAWYDAQAADYAVPVARRLPEPMVTYSVFLTQVESRLGVMQGFPWPTRLSREVGAAAAPPAPPSLATISAIPQIGQSPASGSRICGCIAQV